MTRPLSDSRLFKSPRDIMLPDGRLLTEALSDVNRQPNAPRLAILQQIKQAQRDGLSRIDAEYYVLSGGKAPPKAERRYNMLRHQTPEIRAALDNAKDDLEWLSVAMFVRVAFDPAKPHRYAMLKHLREDQFARRLFYELLMKRMAGFEETEDYSNPMLDDLLKNRNGTARSH